MSKKGLSQLRKAKNDLSKALTVACSKIHEMDTTPSADYLTSLSKIGNSLKRMVETEYDLEKNALEFERKAQSAKYIEGLTNR